MIHWVYARLVLNTLKMVEDNAHEEMEALEKEVLLLEKQLANPVSSELQKML